MAFQKGQSGNPNGRPKGSLNKSTVRARNVIAEFVENNSERLQGWLDDIAEKDGPKEAFKAFSDLLEYHVPKLSRAELVGDADNPVEHVHRIELAPMNGNSKD